MYDPNLQRIIELVKKGEENRVYKLQIWRRKRYNILIRDRNECQICKKNKLVNEIVKATHVHHIKELVDYPELALTDSNLISLCFKCHEEQHDRNINTRNKPLFEDERWD